MPPKIERYKISEADQKTKRLHEAAVKAWATRRNRAAKQGKPLSAPRKRREKIDYSKLPFTGYTSGENLFVLCKKCGQMPAPKETGICRLCEVKE
jgi:hypothetical protein